MLGTLSKNRLRERKDDILLLANYFLNKYRKEAEGKKIKGFTKQAKELMLNYSWSVILCKKFLQFYFIHHTKSRLFHFF
ncbi:MAG: hypothetical protein DRP08_06600 [Candidatus Aenigmatarchaeota archaeon]|nr:MAG: hypothetical protein DRP08_06600 [Candidatus Aenigmarchaeota archaeon]